MNVHLVKTFATASQRLSIPDSYRNGSMLKTSVCPRAPEALQGVSFRREGYDEVSCKIYPVHDLEKRLLC